jgi:hypothetical protein
MTERQIFIGEIGCSSEHNSISGISLDSVNVVKPRLIILEPVCNTNTYILPNEYSRSVFESCGQQSVYGDIFGELQINSGKIGLLFMENVLNDPFYYGRSDYYRLALNL